MSDGRVVPVILTCDRDLEATRRFAESYRTVRHGMAPPVVVCDESAGTPASDEYRALLASLEPAFVHVHPAEEGCSVYDSVQCAAQFALERVLDASGAGDRILFMEDDIEFASRFVEELHVQRFDADTGFITLYLPGHGFGGPEVRPEHYYGTQCLLLPRWSVELLVRERRDMMERFPPGYDIRWSRFLAHRGYKLWQTMTSLVQHLDRRSRLHDGASSHRSDLFLG